MVSVKAHIYPILNYKGKRTAFSTNRRVISGPVNRYSPGKRNQLHMYLKGAYYQTLALFFLSFDVERKSKTKKMKMSYPNEANVVLFHFFYPKKTKFENFLMQYWLSEDNNVPNKLLDRMSVNQLSVLFAVLKNKLNSSGNAKGRNKVMDAIIKRVREKVI